MLKSKKTDTYDRNGRLVRSVVTFDAVPWVRIWLTTIAITAWLFFNFGWYFKR
jgi:hypothetical protein